MTTAQYMSRDLDDPYAYEKKPIHHVPGYTGHLPGEKSAYGSTFGRTCGDCLDEFQASVTRTAAAGYRILPLADFSVASPIKRE